MFANRIRIKLIVLLGLSMFVSSSASATPWMVQLLVESSPDGFDVVQTVVADCDANDMKTAGSGITVEIFDEEGDTLQRFEMRDPRLVFIEAPDGSPWKHEELVPAGSTLMFPQAYHVLSLPLATDRLPTLPVRISVTDASGAILLEAEAKQHHVVPGDVHGCIPPE